MPLFSVVIPTYNRMVLLEQTLRSVWEQTFTDYEVIVVDDGSTDGTRERLRESAKQVTLLTQTHQGPGAARNLGAESSKGEYIAFLDSDDLWFPWTLATYAQIIKEKNKPTLIAGTLTYFYDESEVCGLTCKPIAMQCFTEYLAASRAALYCGTCQMLVRRDAFLQVGGFVKEKINAEDHDLVMRLGMAPGFVFVSAPAMIAYRQHPEAVSRDLSKTFTGLVHMLRMERTGAYPGGSGRRWERRRILTQHARSVSLDLLRQKEYQKAWCLYRQTFTWNVALGRFRYHAGFFLKAALSLV